MVSFAGRCRALVVGTAATVTVGGVETTVVVVGDKDEDEELVCAAIVVVVVGLTTLDGGRGLSDVALGIITGWGGGDVASRRSGCAGSDEPTNQ